MKPLTALRYSFALASIVVNARVLASPITGVQRYTRELLLRWKNAVRVIKPGAYSQGVIGHAWEQFVLPRMVKDATLFSPSNTGPLSTEKQVVTIHDMAVFDCPETFSMGFRSWYQMLLPKLVRRALHIIAVSAFTKGRIQAHIDVSPDRISVIPNGVSSQFRPGLQSGNVLATLGLPSRSYVLAVGSTERRKNIAGLMKAWQRVQKRLAQDTWLVVAGGRNPRVFRDNSLPQVPERVFLLGRVEDESLPALYAGARAVAYLSTYEGFGLPLLEAMASGIPVLASNASSLPEVAAGSTLLVDPFDIEAIENGLERVLEDAELRSRLTAQGLTRATEFSWDRTAHRTWDLLQQVGEA